MAYPGPVDLDVEEKIWLGHQSFLKSCGYHLRPRYQPYWVPSWTTDLSVDWQDAEDALPLPLRGGNLIDAVRIDDKSLVYIKKVRRNSDELKIASYLSSEDLRNHPQNRCVPIDVLTPSEERDFSFIVMPFLRNINSPDFESVEDILRCGQQLLEGLMFLHDHDVAHRDCAFKNVMMDASALYPYGHHPIQHDYLPLDISRRAPVLSRAGVEVKYYFTDFGISTRFAPGDDNRLVLGDRGLNKDVPELSNDVPYDPFKVDVYLLGNVFREEFLEKYRNLQLLRPLIAQMTARDPTQRPTAAAALREWQETQRRTSSINRYWRVQRRDEVLPVCLIRDAFYPLYLIYALFKLFSYSTRRPQPPSHRR